MKYWARIENDRVAEIINHDPRGLYHESLVFVECDESTKQNMAYRDGNFKEYVKTAKEQKDEILNELLYLDSIIPRVTEDLIEQGGFKLHISKVDVIQRKQQLRMELKSL